jgi:U3 small nucleolar RNA-associated protein 5
LSKDTPKSGLEALVNGTLGRKPQFSAKTNGVHVVRQDWTDESRAVVAAGDGGRHGDVAMEDAVREEDVISISSREEESEDSSDDEEEKAKENATGAGAQEDVAHDDLPLTNGVVAPADGPTFGELLQAHAPDEVDVDASYSDSHDDFNTVTTLRLSAPSAGSLGIVLAEALKTNDRRRLDECFSINELDSIRTTVERLPSHLVAKLLQKLAERLHKRPGRGGQVMVWMQWSLIAHGAYLAAQPEVVKQLTDLSRILRQRSSGLQPLLSLKGRLDMLKSQVALREGIQNRAVMEDKDDPVIYVESEDEDSEQQPSKRKGLSIKNIEDTESSGDEMPTTMNGISEEEGSEADSEDSEDLIDDEAEETDADSGDDLSESERESSIELGDADDISESEEEDSVPTKRSTKGSRRN